MYELMNNVELPTITRKSQGSKYPFEMCGVNQAFFVPVGDCKPTSLTNYASKFAKKLGAKFAVRVAEKDGIEGTYIKRIA